MFSTKGPQTLSACLIKATQGRLTDFRCISIMDTFSWLQTLLWIARQMFPTRLASSWTPHWRLCFVSGKVSAALYNHNRRIQTFSLYVPFLSPSYPARLPTFADRSLNIHSSINSGYSSMQLCHPQCFPCSIQYTISISHQGGSTLHHTLTNEKKDTHLWYDSSWALLFEKHSKQSQTLKGTVHPKVKTLRPSKM